ncbi:MAG: hypothetical protein AAF570_01870 [Bacteroidota bacterium]
MAYTIPSDGSYHAISYLNGQLALADDALMHYDNGCEFFIHRVKTLPPLDGELDIYLRNLASFQRLQFLQGPDNLIRSCYPTHLQESAIAELTFRPLSRIRFQSQLLSDFKRPRVSVSGTDSAAKKAIARAANTGHTSGRGDLAGFLKEFGLYLEDSFTDILFGGKNDWKVQEVQCRFPISGFEADLWGEFLLIREDEVFIYFSGLGD